MLLAVSKPLAVLIPLQGLEMAWQGWQFFPRCFFFRPGKIGFIHFWTKLEKTFLS